MIGNQPSAGCLIGTMQQRGAMTRDEIVELMDGNAAAADLIIKNQLAERIITTIQDDPGAYYLTDKGKQIIPR